MHIFLEKFHQCGKYTAQITIHQAELRIEEEITDQKYSSSSSIQTDYLNLDTSSGSGRKDERQNIVQTKCTFCGYANHAKENVLKG